MFDRYKFIEILKSIEGVNLFNPYTLESSVGLGATFSNVAVKSGDNHFYMDPDTFHDLDIKFYLWGESERSISSGGYAIGQAVSDLHIEIRAYEGGYQLSNWAKDFYAEGYEESTNSGTASIQNLIGYMVDNSVISPDLFGVELIDTTIWGDPETNWRNSLNKILDIKYNSGALTNLRETKDTGVEGKFELEVSRTKSYRIELMVGWYGGWSHGADTYASSSRDATLAFEIFNFYFYPAPSDGGGGLNCGRFIPCPIPM